MDVDSSTTYTTSNVSEHSDVTKSLDWNREYPGPNPPPDFWNKKYLEKFGPPTTRFEICGSNFTVLEHGPGLYSTLKLALNGNSQDPTDYKEEVYEFLWKNWPLWRDEVMFAHPEFASTEVTTASPIAKNQLVGLLRSLFPQNGCLTELQVMAEILGFEFCVIFVKEQKKCRLINYLTKNESRGKSKYYFLFLQDINMEKTFWAFLYPIGPLMDIQNGNYKYLVKDAFIFPFENHYPPPPLGLNVPGESSFLTEFKFPKAVKHIVFADGAMEFHMHRTNGDTLYEILAELGYGDKSRSTSIKTALMKLRLQYSYAFNLKPKRKESIEYGEQTDNGRSFDQQMSGDPLDLQIASAELNFSYHLFGLVDKAKTTFYNHTNCNVSNDPNNPFVPQFGFLLWAKNSCREVKRGDWQWYFLNSSKTMQSIHRVEPEPILSKLNSEPLLKDEEIKFLKENMNKSTIIDLTGKSEDEGKQSQHSVGDDNPDDFKEPFNPFIHPSLNFYDVNKKKLKKQFIRERKYFNMPWTNRRHTEPQIETLYDGVGFLVTMSRNTVQNIATNIGNGFTWLSEKAKWKTNVESTNVPSIKKDNDNNSISISTA